MEGMKGGGATPVERFLVENQHVRRLCIGFWSKMHQRGSKRVPKGSKRVPRWPKRVPKRPQKGPKRVQEGPQEDPKALLGSLSVTLGLSFGGSWAHFYTKR